MENALPKALEITREPMKGAGSQWLFHKTIDPQSKDCNLNLGEKMNNNNKPKPKLTDFLGTEALGSRALIYAKGSMAENTMATYQAAWRRWENWAQEHQFQVLPASPMGVADYLAELADRGQAPGSLSTYCSAIRAVHRLAGEPDPTLEAEVRTTLAGIRRKAASAGRTDGQADPLSAQHYARIMNVLKRNGSMQAVRDRALIWLMRDALLRCSELCALEVRDFHVELDGTGRLLIRKSKTDQFGVGQVLFLSQGAAENVKCWIERAGLRLDGPGAALMRKVNRGGRVGKTALYPNSISRILKRLAQSAGIEEGRISGHSCRIGMAVDLARAGISLVEMQQAGRWKSPNMPARYARAVTAGEGAVAKYYKLLKS